MNYIAAICVKLLQFKYIAAICGKMLQFNFLLQFVLNCSNLIILQQLVLNCCNLIIFLQFVLNCCNLILLQKTPKSLFNCHGDMLAKTVSVAFSFFYKLIMQRAGLRPCGIGFGETFWNKAAWNLIDRILLWSVDAIADTCKNIDINTGTSYEQATSTNAGTSYVP